jgi:hypothetical protein
MKNLPSYLGIASVIIYIVALTLCAVYEVNFTVTMAIGLSPVLIPAAIIVSFFLLAPIYLLFTVLWSAVLNKK